jgi:hypothetical protein
LYVIAPDKDATALPTNFGASKTSIITEHLSYVGMILIKGLNGSE